jgi:hypothetical protein
MDLLELPLPLAAQHLHDHLTARPMRSIFGVALEFDSDLPSDKNKHQRHHIFKLVKQTNPYQIYQYPQNSTRLMAERSWISQEKNCRQKQKE